MRSVGQVVGLHAELGLDLFCERKVLEESQVHVRASWTAEDVAPRRTGSHENASRCFGRNGKGRGIDVSSDVAWVHAWLSNKIRARVSRRSVYRYAKRQPSLQGVDAIELPAANYIVQRARHATGKAFAAPEGQFVKGAEGKAIVLVLIREPAFDGVIGVQLRRASVEVTAATALLRR